MGVRDGKYSARGGRIRNLTEEPEAFRWERARRSSLNLKRQVLEKAIWQLPTGCGRHRESYCEYVFRGGVLGIPGGS